MRDVAPSSPIGGANGAQWAFEYGLHRLFRLLPIDVVSGIGSLLGRRLGPKLSPGVAIRARQNLPRIHPDWDAARIEAAIAAYYDNAGRLLFEFAILGRLLRAGRIAVHGIEALEAARRAGAGDHGRLPYRQLGGSCSRSTDRSGFARGSC